MKTHIQYLYYKLHIEIASDTWYKYIYGRMYTLTDTVDFTYCSIVIFGIVTSPYCVSIEFCYNLYIVCRDLTFRDLCSFFLFGHKSRWRAVEYPVPASFQHIEEIVQPLHGDDYIFTSLCSVGVFFLRAVCTWPCSGSFISVWEILSHVLIWMIYYDFALFISSFSTLNQNCKFNLKWWYLVMTRVQSLK